MEELRIPFIVDNPAYDVSLLINNNAGKLAFKCYARAVTMGNKITKFSGVHSHPPDFQPDYQALFANIP